MFAATAYLCRLGGLAGLVDPSSYERFAHQLTPSRSQFINSMSSNPPADICLRVSKKAYKDIEETKAKLANPLQRASKLLARSTLFDAELKQMRHLKGPFTGRPMSPRFALRFKNWIRPTLDLILKETSDECSKIIDDMLTPYWIQILNEYDAPMRPFSADDDSPLNRWCQAAIDLMVITDSLSEGVSSPHDWSSATPVASYPSFVLSVEAMDDEQDQDYHTSLSARIPDNVLATLPKCRTPSVGSNLRSLTHNLTILPAAGTTRTSWDYFSRSDKSDRSPLNILVIPIPYYLHASSFQPLTDHNSGNWNYFRISPDWSRDVPPSQFVSFVRDLCAVAAADVDKIDAIVLPECAITHLQYEALERAILQAEVDDVFYEVEFIVAGTSCRQLNGTAHQNGNFVQYSTFFHSNQHVANSPLTGRAAARVGHAKHHRWKLHDQQIEDYRLSHVLNKGMSWWEYLPPTERQLEVVRFRNTQSLMTLICEDLARVDPGQEVVRCIGPDLLVALLMDSAQIASRWPARYATVLAEDPGSSVLTVTSSALVHRSNEERVRKAKESGEANCPDLSNSIGLWKDATIWSGVPITLEKDCEAVVLTISNSHRGQRSLDGRPSAQGQHWQWKLTDQRQVKRPLVDQLRSPAFGRIFGDNGWSFDIEAARKSFAT